MDKLGKFAYNNPEMLYYYKNFVGTPPLQMVDDIMAIQSCSSKSLQINTTINTFIDLLYPTPSVITSTLGSQKRNAQY
jgi:hypothetical protein